MVERKKKADDYLRPIIKNIPSAMKQCAQWCNWRWPSKAPKPAVGHRTLTFEQACERDAEHLGFHLTDDDDYTLIDLDAVTFESEKVFARAKKCGAYTERSPSGNRHVWGKGKAKRNIGPGRMPGVEMYSRARYGTVTGVEASGSPNVSIQDMIDQIEERLGTYERETVRRTGTKWDAAKHQKVLDACNPDAFYEEWFAISCGLHHSGAPFSVWHEWCAKATRKDKDGKPVYPGELKLREKWPKLKGEGYTLGTLYHYAGMSPGEEADIDEFEDLPPEEKPRRFVTSGELAERARPFVWLVRDVLLARTLNYLGGASHVGKSLLALDLGLNVAHGRGWRGHAAKPVPLIYVAQEGRVGIPNRIQAWGQANNVADPFENVHVSSIYIPLMELRHAQDFAAEVREMANGGPSLVIIDTQSASMAGGEENVKDLNTFLNHIETLLVQASQATVLLVHHSPLDNPWRLRGPGNQKGSATAVVMMGRSEDHPGLVQLKLDKLRDRGQPVPDMFFAPRAVPLNWPSGEAMVDEDGERSVSAVLEHVEAPAQWVADHTSNDAMRPLLEALHRAEGGLSKRDVRGALPMSAYKVDRQLGLAIEAGWVENTGTEHEHCYVLTPAGVAQLVDAFEEIHS